MEEHEGKWVDGEGSETLSVGYEGSLCEGDDGRDVCEEEVAERRCSFVEVQVKPIPQEEEMPSPQVEVPCNACIVSSGWCIGLCEDATVTLRQGRYTILSTASLVVHLVHFDAELVVASHEPFSFEVEKATDINIVIVHAEEGQCEIATDVDARILEELAWEEKLVTASFSSMMRLLQKQKGCFGWTNQCGEATAVWNQKPKR